MFGRLLKTKSKEVGDTARVAVGLDIGTTKVAVFAGMRDPNGKIRVLGYGKYQSLGVERGQVINVAKTVQAITCAIKEAEENGVNIDTVMVGIAGQHICNRQLMGEIKLRETEKEITQSDVRLLVEDMFKVVVNPGEQIIDAIHQEYMVDGIVVDDPVGVVGTQLSSMFNVITGNSQQIRNIFRCIQRCQLKMDSLILEPIASAEVVLDPREKEVGVALVDIGGGTTDVVIFLDGLLRHTAVIPIAGDAVTNDVKRIFGIPKEDAEMLKVKYGSCVPNHGNERHVITIAGIKDHAESEISEVELANVIAARMEEIIDRVMEELHAINCVRSLGCGLVLTGGGARMKDLKPFTEMRTGLKVRIGNPDEKIIVDNQPDLLNPMFATGLGLLVMGIEKDEYLNPLPEEPVSTSETKTRKDIKPVQKEERERKPFIPWTKMQEVFAALIVDDLEEEDDF